MRLKALTIKNFKGIDEHGVRIELAPITLLFGPNSAGKSTILQALHLARVILCNRKSNINKIDALGNVLNIGSFEDYVHLHDKGREVQIGLEFAQDYQHVARDVMRQRLVDFDLRDPLAAFSQIIKEQSNKPVAFDSSEQSTVQIQEFIEAFDALAAAVALSAPYAFGPIGKEVLALKLEKLEELHKNAIHIAKQVETQGGTGEHEAEYDEALNAARQYFDSITEYINDFQKALNQREIELIRLLDPLAQSIYALNSKHIAAMNVEELQLHADTLIKNLDALLKPVTQTIEELLPFMPLKQQQSFDTKRFKKYYDRAIIAMEQISSAMPEALSSMPHEQQKSKNVSLEALCAPIRSAATLFNMAVLAFINGDNYLNPVTIDISIYWDKKLNTAKYDFSCAFSSALGSFVVKSSDLTKGVGSELLRIDKSIGSFYYIGVLIAQAMSKFVYNPIERAYERFALAASTKFPLAEAPLKKLEKLLASPQADAHSPIRAGEFFKNKLKLNVIGEPLIRFGNDWLKDEQLKDEGSLNEVRYLEKINAIDKALDEGVDAQKYADRASAKLIRLIEGILGRALYIGPLRAIPRRGVTIPSPMQYAEWAEGSAAWDTLLLATAEQINAMNSALHGSGSLEIGYTVKHGVSSQGKRLLLHNEGSQIDVEPHDVGTGISQILPVVTAAVLKPDALVMVAQPELHIHPKQQANMGDIFLQAAKSGAMFLLETHSEHLLLRLLKRIRHTHAGKAQEGLSFRNTDLSVNWIGSEDGHTYALCLEVDEDGSFNTPWPEGFFDERGKELFG